MADKFIQFDGKTYALNVKRLFEILSDFCPAETTKEKHKSESWGYTDDSYKDFKLLSKENMEHTVSDKETFASVKYDLYKNLLQLILNPTVDDEGNVMPLRSLDEMYFGQAISFNTLLNDGIIIEITD